MKHKNTLGFKPFLMPGFLRFLNCIFFKIMPDITNLNQDIQKAWAGIQRTQITRMCSFWFLVNQA